MELSVELILVYFYKFIFILKFKKKTIFLRKEGEYCCRFESKYFDFRPGIFKTKTENKRVVLVGVRRFFSYY